MAFLPGDVYTNREDRLNRLVDPVTGLPAGERLSKERRLLKIAQSILLLAFLKGETYTKTEDR